MPHFTFTCFLCLSLSSAKHMYKTVTYWYNAKERSFGQQKRKAYCKAAFPLLYILIVNILSANNI